MTGRAIDRRNCLLGGLSTFAAAVLAPGSTAADDGAARRRLRVGQIGTTHGHATKLEVYRASADWEVVGLVEPDEALAAAAARKPAFQGVPLLTRDELFRIEGLDAVLVETKPGASLEHAAAAIARGLHVHLDKPAGDSLPALRRILDEAGRKGLVVQLGYMYRYNPAILLLQEFLEKGWLGEVFEIDAVMGKVVDPEGRKGFAAFPGGMMFELGCHLVDLVVRILGRPETVTGHLRHALDAADDTLADNTLAVLEWPKAIATIRSSALEVEGFGRRHLTVCGTAGTFHVQPLDDPKVTVSLDRPRGDLPRGTTEIPQPPFTRYIADAADMAAVVRGERRSRFSAEHDLAVQETVLRASGMPLDR